MRGKVEVKSTGCHGFCEKEPAALISPEEIYYVGVEPEDVPEIGEMPSLVDWSRKCID